MSRLDELTQQVLDGRTITRGEALELYQQPLEELKTIASSCSDGGTFRAEVKKRYPAYSGENYLDMTSGFFFP